MIAKIRISGTNCANASIRNSLICKLSYRAEPMPLSLSLQDTFDHYLSGL